MARNHKHGATTILKRRPLLSPPAARVEYPRESETITHPCYTFRIDVGAPAARVDLCIDQGDWLPCREALGSWWYDWSGYDGGEYEAVVRLRKQDGSVVLSEPRIFYVKLPSGA